MENNNKQDNKQDNSLFALEQGLLAKNTSEQQSHQPSPKKRKRPRQEARAFDFGEAIQLQYNGDAYPTATPAARSFSKSNSFASELEDESLPFEVEAFEVDRDVTPVSKQVTPQRETPVKPVEVQPVQATEKVTSKQKVQPVQATKVEPTPPQEGLSDAQEFAADLQAILNGEKTYDAEQKQVVSTSSPPQPKAKVAPTPHPHDIFDKGQAAIPPQKQVEPKPLPMSRSHAVFDQMGKNMAHATDFDQGTVDLSLEQRFDELDKLLDAEEKYSVQREVFPEMSEGMELKEDRALTSFNENYATQLANTATIMPYVPPICYAQYLPEPEEPEEPEEPKKRGTLRKFYQNSKRKLFSSPKIQNNSTITEPYNSTITEPYNSTITELCLEKTSNNDEKSADQNGFYYGLVKSQSHIHNEEFDENKCFREKFILKSLYNTDIKIKMTASPTEIEEMKVNFYILTRGEVEGVTLVEITDIEMSRFNRVPKNDENFDKNEKIDYKFSQKLSKLVNQPSREWNKLLEIVTNWQDSPYMLKVNIGGPDLACTYFNVLSELDSDRLERVADQQIIMLDDGLESLEGLNNINAPNNDEKEVDETVVKITPKYSRDQMTEIEADPRPLNKVDELSRGFNFSLDQEEINIFSQLRSAKLSANFFPWSMQDESIFVLRNKHFYAATCWGSAIVCHKIEGVYYAHSLYLTDKKRSAWTFIPRPGEVSNLQPNKEIPEIKTEVYTTTQPENLTPSQPENLTPTQPENLTPIQPETLTSGWKYYKLKDKKYPLSQAVTNGVSSCAAGVTFSIDLEQLDQSPEWIIFWHIDASVSVVVPHIINELMVENTLKDSLQLRTIVSAHPTNFDLKKYDKSNLYPEDFRNQSETVFMLRGSHLYHGTYKLSKSDQIITYCGHDLLGLNFLEESVNLVGTYDFEKRPNVLTNIIKKTDTKDKHELEARYFDYNDKIFGTYRFNHEWQSAENMEKYFRKLYYDAANKSKTQGEDIQKQQNQLKLDQIKESKKFTMKKLGDNLFNKLKQISKPVSDTDIYFVGETAAKELYKG